MATPFSPAAERNKQPILEKLQEIIAERKSVLEIGSGTAQHVIHFSEAMPEVVWQPSNLPELLEQTQKGLHGMRLENVLEPIALDVQNYHWPGNAYELVYTANTCHIMSWENVLSMVEGVARSLKPFGLFCVYGPFNYAGEFTSESNRDFHMSLRSSDPQQGIRELEYLKAKASSVGLELMRDFDMPANNRFLTFIRN